MCICVYAHPLPSWHTVFAGLGYQWRMMFESIVLQAGWYVKSFNKYIIDLPYFKDINVERGHLTLKAEVNKWLIFFESCFWYIHMRNTSYLAVCNWFWSFGVALTDVITKWIPWSWGNWSVYITGKLGCDQANIFINDCHADMWRPWAWAGHAVASWSFSGRWPNLQCWAWLQAVDIFIWRVPFTLGKTCI